MLLNSSPTCRQQGATPGQGRLCEESRWKWGGGPHSPTPSSLFPAGRTSSHASLKFPPEIRDSDFEHCLGLCLKHKSSCSGRGKWSWQEWGRLLSSGSHLPKFGKRKLSELAWLFKFPWIDNTMFWENDLRIWLHMCELSTALIKSEGLIFLPHIYVFQEQDRTIKLTRAQNWNQIWR